MPTGLKREQIQELKEWLLTFNSVQSQCLFAIFDAARESSILKSLRKSGAEFVSLYRGQPEETLADVAPYLVKIGQDRGLLDWSLNTGWGQSWGVFLISDADFERVRRHLRHFLIVNHPDGTELYFRFYDPRVLSAFLPTCTASQSKQFFGPAATYLTETDDGDGVNIFSRVGVRTIRLADLQTNPASELIDEEHTVQTTAKSHIGRLRIRHEQMQALTAYMNASFVLRAATHLRQEYPDAAKSMGDAELHELIDAGTVRAGKHGLTRENEIVLFLELMMHFGTDFDDRKDWAAVILQNLKLSRTEKVEALQEQLDTVKRAGEQV